MSVTTIGWAACIDWDTWRAAKAKALPAPVEVIDG